MTADRSSLSFGAVIGATVIGTGTERVRLTQDAASPPVMWAVGANVPWLLVTPSGGNGSGAFNVSIQPNAGLNLGVNVGSVTVFMGNSTTPLVIDVVLTRYAPGASSPPSGVVETPADGATGVTGSLAVTGWALDDVEVSRVRVMRDPVAGEGPGQVFIGDAVLVDGARPDVAAANPAVPRSGRAGWGYLLLTNFLPNQGNGTFRLHAFADDKEGHSTLLGTRTITCANSSATKPFGAIDTPAQGEIVSGTNYTNFGWVLASGPAFADPPDGGTVTAFIDGVPIGDPAGWTSRADLTAFFPAGTYPGVSKALGAIGFDTTTLANGVHTLFWVVTASNGQQDGIGSRYFTVANSSLLAESGAFKRKPEATSVRTAQESPLASAFRRKYQRSLEADVNSAPREQGPTAIRAEELDRIELQLGGPGYTGHLRVGHELASLPIGSHLDESTGVFTWGPGVGFVGHYDLVFVRWADGRAASRREVRVTLAPKQSTRVGPQIAIDAPAANATVDGSFVVAGWAIDRDDSAGTGIDTLHVWAYPVRSTCDGAACDPIFLGAAAYGGDRPDVAAIFGSRFAHSGYGLIVDALPPGTYDLAVFAWSTVTGGFTPAKTVRVVVR